MVNAIVPLMDPLDEAMLNHHLDAIDLIYANVMASTQPTVKLRETFGLIQQMKVDWIKEIPPENLTTVQRASKELVRKFVCWANAQFMNGIHAPVGFDPAELGC